ncbi:MAG: peptide deformylase, partial [Spirochaetia bacterium]
MTDIYNTEYKIKTLGEDVLRQRSIVIPEIGKGIKDFAQAMVETMYYGQGIGLAAPQVGELKRMFVCHVTDDKPRIFINPEIIGTSLEEGKYEEGCLSIPGIYSNVIRPLEVQVQAWDENGKVFNLEAGGMLARVILNEIDHLNGTLFIDRLPEK